MMPLETIQALAHDAGFRAKKLHLEPLHIPPNWNTDIHLTPNEKLALILDMEMLGDYVPPGWEPVLNDCDEPVRYFVDISGYGLPDESALTIPQFMQKIEPGYGYAIVEKGQFQGYIGKFRRLT